MTPEKLPNALVFRGSTMSGVEEEINNFLATKTAFRDLPLIVTADGRSRRYNHRGVTIREWHHEGNVRYDAAVELMEGSK